MKYTGTAAAIGMASALPRSRRKLVPFSKKRQDRLRKKQDELIALALQIEDLRDTTPLFPTTNRNLTFPSIKVLRERLCPEWERGVAEAVIIYRGKVQAEQRKVAAT